MMERSRVALFAVFAALIIVAAVVLWLFFGGYGGDTAPVLLPDTVTLPPAEDGAGTTGGLTLAEVTPETVQAVMATLVRPDSYSRTVTVSSYWEGGSQTYTIEIWRKGSLLRVAQEGGGVTKNILYSDSGLYLWYGSDRSHVYHYQGAAPGDSLQMLPTYEAILSLDPADIQKAGYVRYGGGWRIMVAAHTVADRLDVYYISIETGLLEAAERWEGDRLVYSMAAGEADLSAPSEVMFLPIGAPETLDAGIAVAR